MLARVDAIADDFALDPGLGTCGKQGQHVPVGVGQPTLRVAELIVGGTAERGQRGQRVTMEHGLPGAVDLCADMVARARAAGADEAEAYFESSTNRTVDARGGASSR